MVEIKNSLHYVAGGLFAGCALISVCHVLFGGGMVSWFLPFAIGYGLISASIFTSMPILTIVGCAINIIFSMKIFFEEFEYLIEYLSYGWWDFVGYYIAPLLLTIICILLIIGTQNKKVANTLYFVATGIAALRFIWMAIDWGITDLVVWYPDYLLLIGALCTLALSKKDNIKCDPVMPKTVTTSNNTVIHDSPVESQVDRLEKLKKLLDNGIITQEEFDAKKKQMLGL